LGYVEGLNDTRTPLADFINSLLVDFACPRLYHTQAQPALFMTVRGEIAKPRRETGARSPEDLRRTRAVRRRSEGRARRPPACRNSGSAIAAEES
jgi:hypothetical protein